MLRNESRSGWRRTPSEMKWMIIIRYFYPDIPLPRFPAKGCVSIPECIFIAETYIHMYIVYIKICELTSRWVRQALHGALINYHQLLGNMLFATEPTNECTLYLITRLTPRVHPHGGPTSVHFNRENIPSVASLFVSFSFVPFSPSRATLSNRCLPTYHRH